MPKRVLLLGSYGQTNIGDDVLMWNYLTLLSERGYERIYVNATDLSLVPAIIRQSFPQLELLDTYRTSWLRWITILREVDCVVYGGGTIYKEMYASTGRFKHGVTMRMAVFNRLARFLGARLYHLNIGTGSIKTPAGRFLAKLGLGAANYSVFRDQTSYDFARKKLTLPKERIRASTDGLFLNEQWQKPWHELPLHIDRRTYKTVVGVNMLSDIPDWVNRRDYLATMRKVVRQLLEDGHYVLLIPFQHDFNPSSDLTFMQKQITGHLKKYRAWQLLPKVAIDEIQSVLAACDVLVGMRFHSLLLATAVGTPFVAITYDTKCARFIQENDYPYTVAIENLTSDAVLESLKQVLADRQAVQKQLKGIAAKHFKQAREGLRDIHL